MRRFPARWPAAVAVASLILLASPAVAFGANAYGQVFAGQAACLACHGDVGGLWQVSTYSGTAHGRMVVDVRVETSALVPARTSNLWPSPALGGSFGIGPDDIWLQLGAPGMAKEYVSRVRNDGTHTLTTGFSLARVTGPADDWWLFNNQTFLTEENAWEAVGPANVRPYFQTCGGCHNLGVTRPTDTTRTLASGAVVGPSTETSYSGLGIQCETCHGTGSSRSSHHASGVEVVRTRRALKSQTCGQCHVNGTAKEKNYSGGTFSSPNGFTTDRNLSDFFNVAGAQYVRTSPASPTPSIPGSDSKFYPDGHNKGMNHSYYNEWMLSGHANSLRYPDGTLWTSQASDSCLSCHSGEGFLKRIGYGAGEPNDITVLPSTVASDTLQIECGVCHTVHADTAEALGLRLPKGELCQACHNAGIAEGTEATAGTTPRHSQAEMLGGYGLIGVPRPAEPFMTNTDCIDCHMPVTRAPRVSHRFTPLLPGDAEEWGVREYGDSCAGCHPSRDRGELQAELDAWRISLDAGAIDASAAIASASVRPASAAGGGRLLLDSAKTNLAFVLADASGGAHDYEYAKAGLDRAAYFADAVGAAYSGFTATSYDRRAGLAFVYGKLVFGDGSVRADESIVIEAKRADSSTWEPVGTVRTVSSGDFSSAVGPSVTTSYRARWTPRSGVDVVSPLATVVVPASITIATSSGGRVRRGTPVAITGRLIPLHSGASVTIQYRYGSYPWRTLTVRPVSGQGSYSYSFKPPAAGLTYFRATFSGDATHGGSTSGVVAVRVY